MNPPAVAAGRIEKGPAHGRTLGSEGTRDEKIKNERGVIAMTHMVHHQVKNVILTRRIPPWVRIA